MKQIFVFTTLCMIGHVVLAAEKTVSLPLSTTHERVVVALWQGDIKVAPAAGDAMRLVADCQPRETVPAKNDGGLRSLRSSAALPEIVSGDEDITIRTYENGPQCSVALTMPAHLDLNARINRAGAIHVDAWRGRLLAWSASGNVTVSNQSSSLSVTAMNGDATVSLSEAGIDADSAITAANGTLTLTVHPASVPAVRAQARWGDVQTNLDLAFDEVVEEGGSWFVTKSGNEQPLMTLRNLNRDIVIRSPDP